MTELADCPHDRGPAHPQIAATWATLCASWPTRRHASALARSVSTPFARIAGVRSEKVTCGHARCPQRHTRFDQHNSTGRPPVGRSRTHTGRRACTRATAPHAAHHRRCRALHRLLQLPITLGDREQHQPVEPEQHRSFFEWNPALLSVMTRRTAGSPLERSARLNASWQGAARFSSCVVATSAMAQAAVVTRQCSEVQGSGLSSSSTWRIPSSLATVM